MTKSSLKNKASSFLQNMNALSFRFIFASIALSALMGVGLLLGGCSSTNEESSPDAPPPQLSATSLTEKEAMRRSRLISNVRYDLFIDVTGGSKEFSGEQTISFQLKSKENIWLDFQDGQVKNLFVNGQTAKIQRGPVHLLLPKELLVKGINQVTIKFTHDYSRSGAGLHRFQDPADQRVYLYTDFEPFDANRWAPFFDQPDIKAPLTLTVKSPKSWEVSANTQESKVEEKDKFKIWHFPPTAAISTYIYAMVAGPFVVWEDSHKEIPLRLFARKSLAKYVPHEEWFYITKKGFEYFESYFATPYPFGKYDQLIVPEFNAGAMENVGAVTFAERYIQRGGYTRHDRYRMASVVLHEMAHMWFGNLVTMKWWNDLWLNEAFATYMASMALDGATDFNEVWADFRIDKTEAYDLDQTIATHPISGEVKSSSEAFANFDSITYDKGAAVMKVLNQYVGGTTFRNSLRYYFKQHAYSNTTLSDFIAAFEKTTGNNMKPWFGSWLETSGVDTVTQNFSCQTEKSKTGEKHKLVIDLSISKNSRPHAFKVAAFKMRKNGQIGRLMSADIKTRSGDSEAGLELALPDANSCPDFIYANYQDHGYFKLHFDEKSLNFILLNIDQIRNPELRMSLWADLWEMVRDQKFKISQFADMVQRTLIIEQDMLILNFLAKRAMGYEGGDYESIYYYWPQTFEQDRVALKQLTSQFEQIYFKRMTEANKNSKKFSVQLAKARGRFEKQQELRRKNELAAFKKSGATGEFQFQRAFHVFENVYEDQYKLFFDAYLGAVSSVRGVAGVAQMLKNTSDPDRRWRVLYTLCREGFSGVDGLINSELKRDKTDVAMKSALSCRAARPAYENKKEFVTALASTPNIKFKADEITRIGRHLFSPKQREMVALFKKDIYEALKIHWPKLEITYQTRLARGLAPTYCSAEANRELEIFLEGVGKDLPFSLRKPLLMSIDSDRRCLAVRKYNRD